MNRESLIRAAVLVIQELGYEAASLRQISLKAGLSEPVVYSYFTNKANIIYSYLVESVRSALVEVAKIANLNKLNFVEQVEVLMGAHLDFLKKDRAFMQEIFPLVFMTGLSPAQEALGPSRKLFSTYVRQCLDEAVQCKEVVEPPFADIIVPLFWDFHVGILHYWIHDKSEDQLATAEVLQKSMAVIREVLRSELLPRLVDLVYFMIRTHLLSPALEPGATVRDGMSHKTRPKILDDLNDPSNN